MRQLSREVPLWKDVTRGVADWKWQVRNRLRSVDELRQVINLTPEEEEGLEYATAAFPWASIRTMPC